MVYCSKCGTLNPDSAFNCSHCGAQLIRADTVNSTRNIRKGVILPLLVAIVVVGFLILGAFTINSPDSQLLLVAVPVVGIIIAEWTRHQRRYEEQHPR